MEEILNKILSELGGIKEDISGIKQDVSGLKQEMSEVKQEISGVKQEICEMKQDIKELNIRQTAMDKKLDAVYNQTAILTEFRTETNMKLDALKEDLINVEFITATNYKDIVKLKSIK